jgi:hypothetical protein
VVFSAIIDTLASVAAIVAIATAMIGWYRSARRPLKVRRVVIHRKAETATFILMVENLHSYPVIIKRTGCYRRKKHQVQRKRSRAPEYSASFSSSHAVFNSNVPAEIMPRGHTDVRIDVNGQPDVPDALLFFLETSHGYHELWCNDIQLVDTVKVDVYHLEYQHDFRYAIQGKAVYYWKRLVWLFGK